MSQPLFRQEAIDANRVRLTGAVVAATPPSSRLYTLLALAAVAGALLLLVFGEYTSRVEVRGIVNDRLGVAAISAPGLGTVREVHVREGDLVERGQPLVTISLSDGRGGDLEGLSGQINDLDRQDTELIEQNQISVDLAKAELAALRQRKQSGTSTVRSLERQIELNRGQVELARKGETRAIRLQERGAGTLEQVEEARAQIIAAELELESLRERLIAQREDLATADAEIAVRSLNLQQSLSELNRQRAALSEERTGLVRQDRLTLVAPKAGRVGEIDAKVGMRTTPDGNLVSIVPANSEMEVNLFAPSSAMGFVKAGQEVRLRFDAFPYEKHGAAEGKVTWVSEVPTAPQDVPQGLVLAEPMYRIRVKLEAQSFTTKDAALPLRPGMTLSANLILKTRHLWEVLFEPFLEAAHGHRH